jgi:rhamnosyltransferase
MGNNSILCTIVSYNPGYFIKKCVEAIYNQVDEILIVDNGSIKNLALIKQFNNDSKINVIFNDKNLGIACALNKGVKYALKNKYKWILTMDQDSEATTNMIYNMLFSYNKLRQEDRKKIVSIFPSYVEKAFLKNEINIEKSVNREDNKLKQKIDIDYVHYVISEITSGNLVRCDIFNKVGYFEDKLFIDYVDHEFCLRLNKNGYKLIQIENAYLLHQLGNSSKKNLFIKKIGYTNHSYIRRYYITRNRIYVWKKYFTKFPKFILKDIYASFKEFIKIIFFENDRMLKIKMICKGIFDFLKCNYGKLNIKEKW